MILAINGSPRPHRNTASLMKLIVAETKKQKPDADVTWCNLNDMTYNGCQACLLCKTTNVTSCVQKDSLAFVLDLMMTSRAWIIGTPVYMGSVSGQFKLLMDRMYGFTGPNRENRIPSGKKVLVAITQAAGEESHRDLAAYLERFFSRRGLDVKVIRSYGMKVTDTAPNFSPNVQEQAPELVRWLIS